MGDPLTPNSVSMPGPRLVGFRYGKVAAPGKLNSLFPEYNAAADILDGVQEARCGEGRGHDAPSRGCMCGIHAYSSPGHLIQSNRREWEQLDHIPMVALYWGRVIPAEMGFRAQYQVIVGLASPGKPTMGRSVQDSFQTERWKLWMQAFRERRLPIEVVTEATRYDELFALAQLGRRYGAMLADIPRAYRVAPSPKWEPPAPPPPPPSVSPIPPSGTSQVVQPNPNLPAIRVRKTTRRLPTTGYCQCGCGLPTRAMFKPGHDARHKGQLKRRAKNGDIAAQDELLKRGW